MSGHRPMPSNAPPRFLAGPLDQLQLTWRGALAVVLYGTSLLLVNLGGNRTLTYHETMFCEPAREMLATGDWLIPKVGGVPFLDKPPLTAWIAAGAMWLFDSRSEWVVRLPSVISANIAALSIALVAARWFGARIGMVAGMIQFTTYYTLQLSRLAECDTHLIAAVTVAMCSFAAANIDSPRGRSTACWLPWAFALATGLSFLIKGPIGPFIVFSGCGLFLLMNQDLRGVRFFLSPLGLALFALCVLPYPILAYAAHPPILDAWLLHNLGRFQGELEGQKAAGYYLVHLPMVLLPWFPLLPLYLWRRRGQGVLVEPLWRFVICWILPGFLVFSSSAFQKHHYIAPLLPGVSILLSVALLDHLQRRHRGERMHGGWLALIVVVACSAAILGVWLAQPKGTVGICWLIAAFGGSLLLMACLESVRNLKAHLATLLATCWLLTAGAYQFVMPEHDSYLDQTRLAQRINAATPESKSLFMIDLPDSQVTYYLDCPIVRLDKFRDFLNRLPVQTPAEYHVLATRRVAVALEELGTVRRLDECESLLSFLQPSDRLTFLHFTPDGQRIVARWSVSQEETLRR